MNLTLLHGSFEPIIYGICLFLSFVSMAWKFKRGSYYGLTVEIMVVTIILLVHGGSVTGGFAATIAGLLSGAVIPVMFNKKASFTKRLDYVNVEPQTKPTPVEPQTKPVTVKVSDMEALLDTRRKPNDLAKYIMDQHPR